MSLLSQLVCLLWLSRVARSRDPAAGERQGRYFVSHWAPAFASGCSYVKELTGKGAAQGSGAAGPSGAAGSRPAVKPLTSKMERGPVAAAAAPAPAPVTANLLDTGSHTGKALAGYVQAK